MFDVAIIGAGLAGLVCAQTLQQQGYRTVIVEKSRGLGGRLATRRLPHAFADHGVRYLAVQGEQTQQLIQTLCAQSILQPWIEAGYASPTGITAVAKALATGLEIYRNQRVVSIAFDQTWELLVESTQPLAPIHARALVMAIPAPQALMLLEPVVGHGVITALRSVEFDPCLTAIVTYPTHSCATDISPVPWKAQSLEDPDIAWISLENTKSNDSPDPVLVIQSTADFAVQHLDADDLQPIGQALLARAAAYIPQWGQPDTVQVHRWRYAFVRQPWAEPCLSAAPLPLVCAGDWCGGSRVEDALRSGIMAAQAVVIATTC